MSQLLRGHPIARLLALCCLCAAVPAAAQSSGAGVRPTGVAAPVPAGAAPAASPTAPAAPAATPPTAPATAGTPGAATAPPGGATAVSPAPAGAPPSTAEPASTSAGPAAAPEAEPPVPTTAAAAAPADAKAADTADANGDGDLEGGSDDAGADGDDGDKKGKKKYPRFEFSGRLMAGFEAKNRHPDTAAGQALDPGSNELAYGFFLKQARLAMDAYPHKRVKLTLSVNLKQPSIRNAYANVEMERWAQLRVGRFKRPFSRLELRSSGKLPFRERGIFNSQLIEDSNWGDRALGAMFWGEIKSIGINYYLGLMHPLNEPTTISFKQGVDVMGRVEYQPAKVISFGVNGAHKVLDDENTAAIHMNALGGDVRLRTEQLEVLAEFDVAQNAHPPAAKAAPSPRDPPPYAMGAIGYVAYEIPFTKSWSLQPIVLGEWVDTDVDYGQDETFRSVFGLNVLWKKIIRLMPQVELVQPLGTVSSRSQIARETYYLLVSVNVE